MILKFKKLSAEAVAPYYATEGAVGLDLTATRVTEANTYYEYHTDIAVEIPVGFVGLLFPRSSISKTSASLANSVGVVDCDFRGGITMRFRNHSGYVVGDRIGQLVIMPAPKVELVEAELSNTNRGEGGFGSTNK